MAVYCTSAYVQQHLDSDWVGDGTGQISAANITTAIADATEFVQSWLPNYWPFPDVAATPATPLPIQRITAMWAAAICYDMLHMSNHLEDDSAAVTLKTRAIEDLTALRDGRTALQREKISGEAIAWGDNSPIPSNLSKLTKSTETDVIPEATLITGYKYGTDFDVLYDSRFGAWMLRKFNSAITAGTDTVSYDCTYLRTRREVTSPRVTTISVVAG